MVAHVPVVGSPVTVDGVKVNLCPNDETIAFLGLTGPVEVEYAKRHLTPRPWKTFTDKLKLSDPNIVNKIGKTDIYTKTTLARDFLISYTFPGFHTDS